MLASVNKWICSYIIHEVSVDWHSDSIQCGEETLLCSIKLTSKDKIFTTWHNNKTQIIREDEEEFREDEWNMRTDIRESCSGNVLDIFCLAKQPKSGKATVKPDIGRWYTFVNESEFSVTVQPPETPVRGTGNAKVQNLLTEGTCINVKSDESETVIKKVKHDEKQNVSVKPPNQLAEGQCVKKETVIKPNESETVMKKVRKGERQKPADASQNTNASDNCFSVHFEKPPLFFGDDDFTCLIHLGSQCEQKSPDALTVYYYKKQIHPDVKILHPREWKAVVPLKDIRCNGKGEATVTFCISGGNRRSLALNFTVFQEFDGEPCKTLIPKKNQKALLCENILESDIIGEDKCNLRRIAQLCSIKEHDLCVETIDSNVRLIFPQLCSDGKVEKCRKILLHLLRSIYYRRKASETNEERIKWKQKAIETYAANKWNDASFCKGIKTKYADLMQDYNKKACEEIFAFFNEELGLYHIDLHGLLVVDEETLAKEKEELLLEGKSEEEAINIINKRRDQRDEAIKKLKERIVEFEEKMDKAQREKKTWLEVIVGAGHHSDGRPKIKPKVEKYLKEKYGSKVSFVNEGSLVVTFEEYPNRRRCFGHYYCKRCKNDWKSGNSYQNKWQGCLKCYDKNKYIEKCFPVMQQPLSGKVPDNAGAGKEKPHLKQLCQICSEGGSCYEGGSCS